MKILYICRIFTGLESSLAERNWRPTGVPTIYKVMEQLAFSRHDVTFLLAARGIGMDFQTNWQAHDDCILNLSGFPAPLHVLASERRYPRWLGKFRRVLTGWQHFQKFYYMCRHLQPDIIYVDRAHVLAGAILARRYGYTVVLRVMGVYPSMWEILSGRNLFQRLQRWAYRSNFAQVVCTQDGSGGEYWMDEALNPVTPRTMMINGINLTHPNPVPNSALTKIPEDKIIVLFVGRLEPNKGAEPFVDAILSLPESYRDKIHAVVIGTGRQRDLLINKIASGNATHRLTLIERVPHAEIHDVHLRAHIYVSLNRLGQLSNANLEIMSVGKCVIMSDTRPETRVDLVTRDLIPEDAVVRIPTDEREIPMLVSAITSLADQPNRRRQYATKLKEITGEFIPSWEDRVSEEISLLEQITGSTTESAGK